MNIVETTTTTAATSPECRFPGTIARAHNGTGVWAADIPANADSYEMHKHMYVCV